MAKVMTRRIPELGEADAWGIAEVAKGGKPLRVIVSVIQSANNLGRAYVAYDSTSLNSVTPDGIISDAFRLGDGCSENFKIEGGQKLFIAGTAGVYCSIHVYESSGDEEGGC